MIYPKLKSIAKENNWYRSNNSVFGLYKNYFFNWSEGQGFKSVYARMKDIPDDVVKQIDEYISSRKDEIGYKEKVVAADGIFLKFTESLIPLKKTKNYGAMDAIIEVYIRFNIPASNCCAECRGKDRLNYSYIKDVGILFCDSCKEKLMNEGYRNAEAYFSEAKYYLRGTVGAMLFSLAGVVLWVLLGYYMERIFAVVAVIFAYLSLKGYDLFKAKRGTWTPLIIISVSIISIIVSNVATMIFALMMNGFDWEQAWNIIFTNEKIYSAVGKDLMISLLVCAVALYYLGRSLWESHKPATVGSAVLVE